jgi:hypothetical protein
MPSPSHDQLFHALRRLPPAETDPARDGHVRSRCHATLAERRRGPSYRLQGRGSRRLESALVGTFSIVYLVAILYDVMQIYRP